MSLLALTRAGPPLPPACAGAGCGISPRFSPERRLRPREGGEGIRSGVSARGKGEEGIRSGISARRGNGIRSGISARAGGDPVHPPWSYPA